MKKRVLIIILSLAAVLCAGLGFVGCDLLAGLDPNHTHTPSSKWEGDSTYHWHECTALGCSEKLDKTEHDLVHVYGQPATCTNDGTIEYWYCKGCERKYTYAGSEIDNVTISATGHKIKNLYNEQTHWSECETCGAIISSPEAHTSVTYIKSRAGHYKLCTECGVRFDEGTHVDGESCLTCGYAPANIDKYASDYGYRDLGTFANGEKYQDLYDKMDEVAKSFHNDESKSATAVSVGGNTVYVAGEVDYAAAGLTLSQAQSVWSTYRNDHPLYYWLSGRVVFNSQTLSLCVDEDYIDGNERSLQNDLIDIALDEYLSAVSGETSAYQIAFAFHDMIIDNINYAVDDKGNPEAANWAHSIVGALSGESAVCEGYAKAFSLLLNACDIENVYVTGTSKGIGHAWNLVKLEGSWYWYDLTWDDQPTIGDGIIYKYMCKSGDNFEDHIIGETGNMDSATSFLYNLPTPSIIDYFSSSLEYDESFTIGEITYSVSGYNKVNVKSASVSGEVVLPESVTFNGRTYTLKGIGTDAFTNNRQITSITIPKSVRVIYNKSFVNCTRLNSVIFEDKSGWSRIPNDGETTTFTEIAESSLQNASGAAALLKELYGSFTYTWVNSSVK